MEKPGEVANKASNHLEFTDQRWGFSQRNMVLFRTPKERCIEPQGMVSKHE
jgi:hypothetical protein